MKGLFFVLGLFFAMGFVFALPVLNVQGRIINATGSPQSGNVVGNVYSTADCSGSVLMTKSDSTSSNGVFDLAFDGGLFSSNADYSLRLSFSSTNFQCQVFYPTQIQSGVAVPTDFEAVNANASGRLLVGGFGGDSILKFYYYSGSSYPFLSIFRGNSIFGIPNDPQSQYSWAWFRVPSYFSANAIFQSDATFQDPVTFESGVAVQGALTVSPGPVKTNVIQPASGAAGTSVTVEVAAAGRLYVKNGTTTYEVCMKNGNCGSGSSGGNYVRKDNPSGTEVMQGALQTPTVYTPNVRVADTSQNRGSIRIGEVALSTYPSLNLVPSGDSLYSRRYAELRGPLYGSDTGFGGLTLGSNYVGNTVLIRGMRLSSGVIIPLEFTSGIISDSVTATTVQPSSGDITLGRTGNSNYPFLKLTQAAGSIPKYVQVEGGLLPADGGSFAGLTLHSGLSSSQIRGRNLASGADIPVYITTGLGVGSSSGLNVLNGPLTVGSGTSGSASVGSLSVRGTTAKVGGKDVCLEDGTNCPAGGGGPDTQYKIYVLPMAAIVTGWTNAVEWGPTFDFSGYPNIDWTIPHCWAYCNGHNACGGVAKWIDKTPSCSSGFTLAGCSVTRFQYSTPGNNYEYSVMKSLCINT